MLYPLKKAQFMNRNLMTFLGQNSGQISMPPEAEINKQFIEVVKELELSVERQVTLFALPIDKKWQMICAKKTDLETSKGATDFPDYYIDSIKRRVFKNSLCIHAWVEVFFLIPFLNLSPINSFFSFCYNKDMLDLDNIESDEYSRRLKLLDGLKSALRTQSLSFVERFIELDGLTRLLEFLLSMNTGTVES